MNNKHITLYCLLCCLLIPTLTHAKIVFKSYRDVNRSLYVMDDDGSNVQRLTGRVAWPVWSPDGKQIAFDRDVTEDPKQGQKQAIFIINSDGTGEYQLTNGDALEGKPSWSPDGRHIAFRSNRVDRSQIWTINLETKELRRLTRTDALTTSPSWSPDGKYIAYRDDSPHGKHTIFVMHANGSAKRELAKGDFFRRRYSPRWSPDSRSVVCPEDIIGPDGRFVSMVAAIYNLAGGKPQVVEIPDKELIHSVCFMDSKQLLITLRHWNKENPNAEKYDIYRYHLVTGEIVNLTNTPAVNDFAMDWISDDVLSVSAVGKKKVTWGILKE